MTRAMRFAILQRDGFRCFYCGRAGDATQLEVDHIEPLSLGGEDRATNLITGCIDCNQGKSDSFGGRGALRAASDRTGEIIKAHIAAWRRRHPEYSDPSQDKAFDELVDLIGNPIDLPGKRWERHLRWWLTPHPTGSPAYVLPMRGAN